MNYRLIDWSINMKVFLIIVVVIVISEVFEFASELVDSISDKKKLRSENKILKNELEKANETIMNNLGEFARIMESTESRKEIEDLKSRNTELLMENMQLKSLIGAYRNVCGNGYQRVPQIPKDAVDAVRYAMKHTHPDNGGKAEDFMRFQKCYEELTRK